MEAFVQFQRKPLIVFCFRMNPRIEMLRRILKRREFLLCGGLLPNLEDYDMEEYKKLRGFYIEDPWERVKALFKKDGHGNLHPELSYVMNVTQFGLFIGAAIGGFPKSLEYIRKHTEYNDAKVYRNRREAQKILSNKSLLGFINGAVATAPKYGLFLGSMALLTSCIELYRNKSGIIEYSFAGSIIGALFRFQFGIRGMFSGSVVGLTLGTVYGVLSWTILKITGKENFELKFLQFAMASYRKELQEKSKVLHPTGVLETNLEKHEKNPLDNFETEKEK